MPLESIYNRNFGFIEQKMNFEHYREFQARKTQLIDIIFVVKKISVDLFRAASYMLMLVLHKDALFKFVKLQVCQKHLTSFNLIIKLG